MKDMKMLRLFFMIIFCVGCAGSKSKNSVSTAIDTTSKVTTQVIPVSELAAMGLELKDSISLLPYGIDFHVVKDKRNQVYRVSTSEKIYKITQTSFIPTKFIDRSSTEIKINSDNKTVDRSKEKIKGNKDKSLTNSANKDKSKDKSMSNTGNRGDKIKFSSFPWWILIIVAVVAWLLYRYWKKIFLNKQINKNESEEENN